MDLESALKNYLAQKAPGKMPYLAVVHRLDQPVEGVLVFAKTPGAAGNLSKQMMAGGAGKYYLAVTEGVPKEQEGTLISYLKKNGAVRRITGSSLPVGLRGTPAAPDITTVTLEPGSFAVMISDGVADPSRDEWLQDLLAGWGGDDPQTLANLILSESIRRERLQDDCAVQVLYRPPQPEQPV